MEDNIINPDTSKKQLKGIWIPKEILSIAKLGWTKKILIAEIDSLSEKQGCFASDRYLAEILNVSEGQIGNLLTELRKAKIVETIKYDGRKRWLSLTTGFKKSLTKGSGNNDDRIQENPNIYNNIENSKNIDYKNEENYFQKRESKNKNLSIDYLFREMKTAFGLDELAYSERENRKACWSCIQKWDIGKTKDLIHLAANSTFWCDKITSFVALNKHGVTIEQNEKGNKIKSKSNSGKTFVTTAGRKI